MSDVNLLSRLQDYVLHSPRPFTLKSGKTSNYYFDGRAILADPSLCRVIAYAIVRRMREAFEGPTLSRDHLDYAFFGVAVGGVPWATLLGQEAGRPCGFVRPSYKDHGTGKQVEGADPHKYARNYLVEDVITTGGSLTAAAANLSVQWTAALCILNRNETSVLEIGPRRLPVLSLVRLDEATGQLISPL